MARIGVDLAFTPGLLGSAPLPGVVVMIDVLRATSTITTLFQLGARSVSLPSGLRQARALARNGRPVGAELPSGRQAPGCGLPVSPSRLTDELVAGQDVVLCTANGTRALRRAVPRAGHLLIGCLLNASAVAERALGLATELGRSVTMVCAGRQGNRIPCIDDAYTAGLIVERTAALAALLDLELELTDAAKIGLTLRRAAGGPEQALASSATGAVMRRVQSEADIAFCGRLDTTAVVPVVTANGAERYPVILL
jgi:2-phosphosulfolactate phosphatase